MDTIVQSEVFRIALAGGTLTAILCAATGYFMVLKALAFASEALTDIGFAGATGSVLMGWNPFLGTLGFGLLTVFALGTLGNRLRGRDVEVGMVLSFALGLGVLFLTLYARSSGAHASSGIGLLFGSLLSLSASTLALLTTAAVVVIAVLVILFRPLLYSSVDPVTARAKGVPTKVLDFAYLLLLAATTAVAIQAMGVLLAFTLLSAPAGAALKLTRHPRRAFLSSMLLGIGVMWASLLLAFFGPWPRIPLGFYVATLSAMMYGAALLRDRFRRRAGADERMHHHERETND